MTKTNWNPWFGIPVLVFFSVGLWLLARLAYGAEILFWNEYREQPLNTLFKWATRLGEFSAYAVFVVLLLLLRQYRFALLLSLTGLAVIPVVNVMKNRFQAPRPIAWFEQQGKREELVLVPGEKLNRGRTSFPSGHTAGAFALFTALTFMLPPRMRPLGLPLALLAIACAVSRIFLVQHFLADVLAGAAIGIGMALISAEFGMRNAE
ncbi:MAG: phosphatase PAP2 family protein [Saprospiraceae bacterium]|nr:phosphatase PAP2 family protein [Saprospiraceae bacterium]